MNGSELKQAKLPSQTPRSPLELCSSQFHYIITRIHVPLLFPRGPLGRCSRRAQLATQSHVVDPRCQTCDASGRLLRLRLRAQLEPAASLGFPLPCFL